MGTIKLIVWPRTYETISELMVQNLGTYMLFLMFFALIIVIIENRKIEKQ